MKGYHCQDPKLIHSASTSCNELSKDSDTLLHLILSVLDLNAICYQIFVAFSFLFQGGRVYNNCMANGEITKTWEGFGLKKWCHKHEECQILVIFCSQDLTPGVREVRHISIGRLTEIM